MTSNSTLKTQNFLETIYITVLFRSIRPGGVTCDQPEISTNFGPPAGLQKFFFWTILPMVFRSRPLFV
jgi:hypothetical protein